MEWPTCVEESKYKNTRGSSVVFVWIWNVAISLSALHFSCLRVHIFKNVRFVLKEDFRDKKAGNVLECNIHVTIVAREKQ